MAKELYSFNNKNYQHSQMNSQHNFPIWQLIVVIYIIES